MSGNTAILMATLESMWPLIAMVVVTLGIAWIVKSAWFKGKIGELMVNYSLKRLLDKDNYHIINGVMLPTEQGTTQIDHIVVSKYGVFVIETKNMKGWIFGGANQKMWTQKIFKYSGKFQNPLHQNYKHTKTLGDLISLEAEKIFSVVVFVGDSQFKNDMPANVTYASGCARYILTKKQVILTDSEVEVILKQTEEVRLANSFKNNRVHAKHVKDIIANKELDDGAVSGDISSKGRSEGAVTLAGGNACPKCNSHMSLRETATSRSRGEKFWGCVTYPKCNGTRPTT